MAVTQDLGDSVQWQREAALESLYASAVREALKEAIQIVLKWPPLWNWSDGAGGFLHSALDDLAVAEGLPLPGDAVAERRTFRDSTLDKLIKRDGPDCAYCHKPTNLSLPPAHIDHVVPKSRGGTNKLENLAIACPACNGSKGAKMLEDWQR